MNILRLRLLVSVSRTLSFTRTANDFFMTQPAVSHQIKALEDSLGVQLLQRNPHRVELTPEGIEYVRYAKEIIALEDTAETRLNNMKSGRSGCIRIAMMSSSAYGFSDCVAAFSPRAPHTQVDIDLLEGTEMAYALSQRNHDFYFANLSLLPTTGEIFEYVTISDGQLHLFFHKDLADSINMDDWSTIGCHRFVSVYESDVNLISRIRRICANRGITPDIINHFNRADAVVLSVNAGMGLAILPRDLVNFYNCPNVIARPIEGEDARHCSVVAWRKNNTNPDAAEFIPVIRECIGDDIKRV